MAEGEACLETPLSRAQEPLVRMTEAFLRDDVEIITSGSSIHSGYWNLETAAISSFQTRKENSCTSTEENSCTTNNEESSTDHNITEYLCVEDLESAQQMHAFGLPLSFGSSKARNNATSRSKRNGLKPNSARQKKERNNSIPQFMAFGQMENPSLLTSLHVGKEHSWGDFHIDESKNICALGIRNETGTKQVLNKVSDAIREGLLNLEFSLDTVRLESNVEVSSSLSLHSDNHPEETLEDTCYQAQCQVDGVLLNKHDLDRCSVNSSTSYCHMHLKWDTQTLQSSISAEPSLHFLEDHHDNFICCEWVGWMVFWDPFYKKHFFYNFLSMESTWHLPLDMKNYAFVCINLSRTDTHEAAAEKDAGGEHSRDSNSVVMDSLTEIGDSFCNTDEQPDAVLSVKISAKMEAEIDFSSNYTTNVGGNSNVQFSLCPSHVTDDKKDEENECTDLHEQKEKQQDDIFGSYYGHDRATTILNKKGHSFNFPEACTSSTFGVNIPHETVATNKKRRVRKSQDVQQLTQCHSDGLFKYWCQRYSLFSRFDEGIKLDEESWFSVTPEQIAKHHAIRCSTGIVVDCFAGVGGNAIQFAMRNNNVIAIDVDPIKIDYAKHNADIYGVSARIDFIEGDFFKIASSLKGDVAFLAPPWGGPSYCKQPIYDLRSLKPHDGFYLFKIASLIAPKVVMFLPRNVNINQLVELMRSVDPPWNLEVEKNFLNGKLKTMTAYFDCPTK
ncbi:uncharacterized protein LOC110027433 [Phalaenopsis equestris]|uniref:uncharacterized protein LOC110027433 n=1 Tax=Phalaenopsis equestris TaxID=78828 RepID=UPI0009E65B66|nr:uncharacterized protein LOC110027433 [Phalaenopsis equestris]